MATATTPTTRELITGFTEAVRAELPDVTARQRLYGKLLPLAEGMNGGIDWGEVERCRGIDPAFDGALAGRHAGGATNTA